MTVARPLVPAIHTFHCLSLFNSQSYLLLCTKLGLFNIFENSKTKLIFCVHHLGQLGSPLRGLGGGRGKGELIEAMEWFFRCSFFDDSSL